MKAHRLYLATVAMVLSLFAVPAGAALAHAKPAKAHHPAHHSKKHRGHQKAHTVSFMAEVVRSNANGLVLRTNDGRLLSFSTHQIRAGAASHLRLNRRGAAHAASDLTFTSGGVVINVLGLQPGTIVDVTESIAGDGSITITITLPASATSEQTSGVVTDVGDDAFTITGPDGSSLEMHMSSDKLSALNLQDCQTVDVTYHSDGGVLIADSVTPTGTSTDGSCAPTTDTNGVITQVSDSSVTLSTDQGPATFSVDPSSGLTDGFRQGDLVDVTSTANPDGSQQATNICFVEENADGPVTAVTTTVGGGSLTINDSDSGAPVTVYADPSNGVQINAYAFNGVSVGDDVSVSYHQSAGQLIADTVSEQ